MPQITLNSKQVAELASFIQRHGLKTFFLAKDQGAYVGATAGNHEDGTFENILFYFKGCDPNKDEDYYENARYAFGGDDFGEHLDADFILKMSRKRQPRVTIKVTATQIKMDGSSLKEDPEPRPIDVRPAPSKHDGKKHNVGTVAREAIAEGYSNQEVLDIVKASFPGCKTKIGSIAWYRSQMKKAA